MQQVVIAITAIHNGWVVVISTIAVVCVSLVHVMIIGIIRIVFWVQCDRMVGP